MQFQTRIRRIGQQNQFRLRILAQQTLAFVRLVELETLDIRQIVVVGIIEHSRPHLAGIIFLDEQDILLVVVIEVEIREIEFTRLQNHKNLFFVLELTQELPMLIVIDALHVWIVPHLSSSQSGSTMRLQLDAIHIILRQQVATRSTSLDGNFTEILLEGQSPHLVVWLQRHLNELCLTVGISGEITDARLRRSHRHIVLPIARHGSHVEALDVAHTRVAILVADIIYRALVVLLEHIQIDNFRLAMVALAAFGLTHKHFLRHLDNLVSAIAVENDDVINI